MGICVTDAVAGDNYNYLQEENCVKGTLFKNKECKDDCKNKPWRHSAVYTTAGEEHDWENNVSHNYNADNGSKLNFLFPVGKVKQEAQQNHAKDTDSKLKQKGCVGKGNHNRKNTA